MLSIVVVYTQCVYYTWTHIQYMLNITVMNVYDYYTCTLYSSAVMFLYNYIQFYKPVTGIKQVSGSCTNEFCISISVVNKFVVAEIFFRYCNQKKHASTKITMIHVNHDY